MRYKKALAAAWIVSGLATPAWATSRYIVFNSDLSVDSSDKGMLIGRPGQVVNFTDTVGRCGYYDPPGGMGPEDDLNYENTGSGGYGLLVRPSGGSAARIPQRMFWDLGAGAAPSTGDKFESVALLHSGQTCTETISSTTFTFKKYVIQQNP